jgi:hypothetical protein
LDIADGNVTFRYKDYRHDSQQKTMTLKAEEFIRRFLAHSGEAEQHSGVKPNRIPGRSRTPIGA